MKQISPRQTAIKLAFFPATRLNWPVVISKPILAVGSIALDTIETPAGRREDLLGGSATFFAVATSLFAPVRLVGVVGDDFPQAGWDLFRERSIDTRDVQTLEGSTFRWGGRYPAGFKGRETLFTELGVFEGFQPLLSAANRGTEIVYLGNIQPSLQLDLARQVDDASLIVSDTMNLWIDTARQDLDKVLAASDIFLINDEEAEQLTGNPDLDAAAAILLAAGPRAVIIKMGSRGSMLAQGRERTRVPIFPGVEVIDPTGAGDTFAGGFLGHIAVHGRDDLAAAVVQGTAVASFAVEGFGLDGIRKATLEKVVVRAAAIAEAMAASLN